MGKVWDLQYKNIAILTKTLPLLKQQSHIQEEQEQFTELDAYPLPRIDEMINNLVNYKLFSTYDLKSAYHQILLISF